MNPVTIRRKTLARRVQLQGFGIFSGLDCEVTLAPAKSGIGILFRLPEGDIPVTIENLQTGLRYSQLQKGKARIAVVEHLLSAVTAFQITDLIITPTEAELPFFDGSAIPWVEAIQTAGTIELTDEVTILSPRKPVFVSEGDRFVAVVEYPVPLYAYFLDYPGIGAHWAFAEGTLEEYLREVAPARSFITRSELEEARKAGLLERATEKSGVLFEDGKPLQNLRFDNEPARHKILDMMGDFALSGLPIRALIIGVRSGHHLNHLALRQMVAQM